MLDSFWLRLSSLSGCDFWICKNNGWHGKHLCDACFRTLIHSVQRLPAVLNPLRMFQTRNSQPDFLPFLSVIRRDIHHLLTFIHTRLRELQYNKHALKPSYPRDHS